MLQPYPRAGGNCCSLPTAIYGRPVKNAKTIHSICCGRHNTKHAKHKYRIWRWQQWKRSVWSCFQPLSVVPNCKFRIWFFWIWNRQKHKLSIWFERVWVSWNLSNRNHQCIRQPGFWCNETFWSLWNPGIRNLYHLFRIWSERIWKRWLGKKHSSTIIWPVNHHCIAIFKHFWKWLIISIRCSSPKWSVR